MTIPLRGGMNLFAFDLEFKFNKSSAPLYKFDQAQVSQTARVKLQYK